jgi:hypothetical protein
MYCCRKDRNFRKSFYTERQHKFLVKYFIFVLEFILFKIYENHGTCWQSGRDIKWRKRELCCASQLIETKCIYWVIMFNCLHLGIWNLVFTQRIYIYIHIYAYVVRSMCTKQFFKVRNYEIIPRPKTLRLCMTAKFNKSEMNIEMQFFK